MGPRLKTANFARRVPDAEAPGGRRPVTLTTMKADVFFYGEGYNCLLGKLLPD